MSRALAIQLFGIDAALAMANAVGRDGKPDWRGIFEIKAATQQCQKVIGNFKSDLPCYICGLPIPSVSPASHELHVECEHVLPVAEARWYLDLYDGSDKQDLDMLKLEYAYAHRVCNQAKSDDSFITVKTDKVDYDKPTTLSILNATRARASRAKEKYKDVVGSLAKISTMDSSTRAEQIRTQKVTPILEKINSLKPEGLATLARTASVVDDSRLKPAARDAYKPFSDPSYQIKRENYNARFEKFKSMHKNDMLRIAERLFGDIEHEWTTTVRTMIEAENEAFLRDWFIIFYKNSLVDEAGIIVKQNPNAYTFGALYAEFKMKLHAYKLFPYISSVVNSDLNKIKCSIIEFIGAVLSKFRTESEMLKKAGILIEKSEIENVITDEDAEMCVVYEKKRATALHREESKIGKEDIEVPDEIFTEEESFLDSEGQSVPPEELNMDSKLVRTLISIGKRGGRRRKTIRKRSKKVRNTRRV